MYKNIFYVGKLGECGGIEAFEYYLAKHFKENKNIEIELGYKECHPNQLAALSTVAKCVKYTGQDIICDNFFFPSRDCSDNLLVKVKANNIIECFHMAQDRKGNTKTHPKVTKYIAVSKESARIGTEVTGKPCECFYPIIDLYKPTKTKNTKILKLISTGRLDDIDKGPDLMKKLADRLVERGVKYEWVIYGTKGKYITDDRFLYKGQLLDKTVLSQEIVKSDFFVQFTKAEGFGMSISEALHLDVPIVTTPFSVLQEHNVNDNNCLIMDFNGDNIDYIIDKMLSNTFNFKYDPPKSDGESLLYTPKVSIIIPVYNQEDLIIRCLDSIPYRNDIEILVVDDCSTDNTFNILKNYKRLPLKVFHLTKNMGVGYARNIGLDNAKGEYIYGIDSDDYIDVDKFNYVINSLPISYDIIHQGVKLNDGELGGPGCCAMHTMFIKRSFLGDIRCPEVRCAEDLELLNKLKAKNPKEIMLDKELYFYNYNYPRKGSLDWINNHENFSS